MLKFCLVGLVGVIIVLSLMVFVLVGCGCKGLLDLLLIVFNVFVVNGVVLVDVEIEFLRMLGLFNFIYGGDVVFVVVRGCKKLFIFDLFLDDFFSWKQVGVN